MEEEIFGPFLPVISFESLEQCSDLIKVHKDPLAHLSVPSLPFGGVGASGQGSYHGKYSFETFSRKVSILKKSLKIDLPFRYLPYKGFNPKKFFKKIKINPLKTIDF